MANSGIVCDASENEDFDCNCADDTEDDTGYLDVTVSELKHPPPQLSPMPKGLSSQQVRFCLCACMCVCVCLHSYHYHYHAYLGYIYININITLHLFFKYHFYNSVNK